MVTIRVHAGDGNSRARRCLTKVTSLALGIAMFGTIGLSGALAQNDDVAVGIADADAIVNSIIAEIFAELFGGEVVADDAAVSGGGDINVGGNSGGTVSMGGSSGGGISIGGGRGGGVTVGDDSGG